METSLKNNIKVGIFVLGGLIVVLTSIFLLGADKSLFTSYVRLHAQFKNVQGLVPGSVVSLAGVNIGNIEDIRFIPEQNLLDVILKVEQSHLSRIREGSEVEIKTQGALGDKFIYIIPGDYKNPELKEGSQLKVAESTDLFDIVSARGKETEKVFDIINELYVLTKTINSENRVGKIMDNFSTASKNFNDVSGEMKTMVTTLNLPSQGEKIKDAIDRMDSIVSKIDRGQGTLGALINDSSLHDQIKGFFGASQRKSHIKSVIRSSIEKNDEIQP